MRTRDHDIDRRAFLTGNVLSEADKARRPAERFFHISSAVVTVRPEKAAEEKAREFMIFAILIQFIVSAQ